MKSAKMMLAAAAMGGLLAGATSRVSAAGITAATGGAQLVAGHANPSVKTTLSAKPGTLLADDTDKGKHDCKGKNDCKGKGGCKSGDNGCKGKNSCKGHGGCKAEGNDKK